ncbi:MAG: M20/M25/M40 family metallo-hydrolase, partial [Streptosporangiaceae bacterium]
GVALSVRQESFTPVVRFDQGLRDRIAGVLAAAGAPEGNRAPVLPTGAGHDAGVLAARVPTAMLFVRNPTGVSHSPAEHADPADCEAGVRALAAVLEDLAR